MTNDDYREASLALANWFQSQDMSPADAGVCMIQLTAQLLFEKSTNPTDLQRAVHKHSDALTSELVCLIKGIE